MPTAPKTFDVTISADSNQRDFIEQVFDKFCDYWCYQLEKGELTNYLHYQCRVLLLHGRTTGSAAAKATDTVGKGWRWSVTSGANRNNYDYCSKDHTRVDGPWKCDDLWIPRQYRIDTLLPFQQYIFDHRKDWTPRQVNVIVDLYGNRGKSTFAGWMACNGYGIFLPPCATAKEMMEIAYAEIKGNKTPGPIFIDLPKATSSQETRAIFMAIESIQRGIIYDSRYTYKKWVCNSPQVWVFTNHSPNMDLLTADRWKTWTIDADGSFDCPGTGEFQGAPL